jgi:hypothetical protein
VEDMSANFTIYQGDSRDLFVSVTDLDGAVVNITGATIKWVLVNNDTVVLEKSTPSSSGINITNPTGGQFTISILPNETLTLSAGDCTHEARLTDSNGKSSLIFKDTLTVLESKV